MGGALQIDYELSCCAYSFFTGCTSCIQYFWRTRDSWSNTLSLIRWLSVLLIAAVGFEETTFDVLWDLAKPGSDAEESFLRVPQTQYYRDEIENVDVFKKMPNVSSSSEIHTYRRMTIESCPFAPNKKKHYSIDVYQKVNLFREQS